MEKVFIGQGHCSADKSMDWDFLELWHFQFIIVDAAGNTSTGHRSEVKERLIWAHVKIY